MSWISPTDAVEFIRIHLNTTSGHAEKLLRDARASGEVYFVSFDEYRMVPEMDYAFDKGDLEGWLRRNHLPHEPASPPDSPRKYRNLGDETLIKRGREMVAKGMSKRKVAEALAEKAEGGTFEQKADRLRKLL